jgi:drug/metabolite transporter (DMT)-like permease
MLDRYGYALLSGVAWAVSAVVVNAGLDRLPDGQRRGGILLGTIFSLVSGALALAVFSDGTPHLVPVSFRLIAGGTLLYFVGTLMYFLCAAALGKRAQIAAQFLRIKPLFSTLIAVVFLGESLRIASIFAMCLILFALTILAMEVAGDSRNKFGFTFGLLIAMSRAAGEALIKTEQGSYSAVAVSFTSLLIAIIVSLVVTFPLLVRRGLPRIGAWSACFVGYGILSMGIGYTAFFASTMRLGLARTVLVTAFWPALALLLVTANQRLWGNSPKSWGWRPWISAAVLVLASLVELIGN